MTSLRATHSTLVSAVRLGRGWVAVPNPNPPAIPLELFEFEACPYCRKVREVLTELDISYICRPCPRGSNNRDQVVARGGTAMFPYLIDPNTHREMYQSEDIITYLMDTYGAGRSGFGRTVGPLNTLSATLASALRPVGRTVAEGSATRAQPDQLLELYGYEASPFCRLVRETLHELNLDHRVHNVGKNGARRSELVARGGRMMVPYLVDPNHAVEMYESAEIVRYLREGYGPRSGIWYNHSSEPRLRGLGRCSEKTLVDCSARWDSPCWP